MNRTSVYSTNIKSVGFDAETNTLEVEFSNGGIYQYSDVPPMIYQDLMASASKGRFLNQAVKGKYTCKKIQ